MNSKGSTSPGSTSPSGTPRSLPTPYPWGICNATAKKAGQCTQSPPTKTSKSPSVSLPQTGQYSPAKPAVTPCNGRLYVSWAGTDEQLNVGWGSTGGSFSNVVTFQGQLLYQPGSNTIPTIHTGPALACYKPSWTSSTLLYVAWTGTDQQLNVGWFDGNPTDPYILNQALLGQYSQYSPALTPDPAKGVLRIGWTGRSNKYPNIESSASAQSGAWSSLNTWRSQTSAGGIGLTMYNSNPWISWVGTDSNNTLNTGYFNLSSGGWGYGSNYAQSSLPGYDANLALIGSTLYFPWADGYPTYGLNVASSPNGINGWSNSGDLVPAVYGGSGCSYSGGLWLTWTDAYTVEVGVGQY